MFSQISIMRHFNCLIFLTSSFEFSADYIFITFPPLILDPLASAEQYPAGSIVPSEGL